MNEKGPFDFSRFQEEFFPEWVELFRSGSGIGDYSYKKGGPTSLYGTTDMLISRCTLGELDLSEGERDEWATCINQFQKPDTGWYRKTYTYTHYREHTTAYAVAALHLINRRPAYPMGWRDAILSSTEAMEKWIRGVNWSLIWPGSHIIAGIPAMLLMLGEETDEFLTWYFNWLDREADPASGFWCRGLVHRLRVIRKPTKHEMGGAFHMYYVYEFCSREWRYPERIIDHTLRLQQPNGLWDGEVSYCIDLDGIYCLTRSCRIADGYRKDDVRAAVVRYLAAAEKILTDREFFFRHYSNSHILPGALSAIAECQKLYPELVKTPRPWIQTLDRACFI